MTKFLYTIALTGEIESTDEEAAEVYALIDAAEHIVNAPYEIKVTLMEVPYER